MEYAIAGDCAAANGRDNAKMAPARTIAGALRLLRRSPFRGLVPFFLRDTLGTTEVTRRLPRTTAGREGAQKSSRLLNSFPPVLGDSREVSRRCLRTRHWKEWRPHPRCAIREQLFVRWHQRRREGAPDARS